METGFWTVFEGVVNTFSGGALILRFFWGGSGSCCPVRLQVLLEPGFEGAEPWFRSDFREETCKVTTFQGFDSSNQLMFQCSQGQLLRVSHESRGKNHGLAMFFFFASMQGWM